jgi:hypothetical protein
MFNPSITFEIKALWDYTSSFYNMMYESDREVIEDYWTALLEGIRGLHYDLYQYNLLKALDYSRGFIENVHKYYDIYLEEDYAEERGKLEEKPIKIHAFDGVLYAITSKRIYKSTDQAHWEDSTLNLLGEAFTCKDMTDDGTTLFLLTTQGVYKKEAAVWTSIYETTIFDHIAANDTSILAIANTNKIYLGDLNYLTEYAFVDLAEKENYTYSGTELYSLEWVNDIATIGTDTGLLLYDPSIVQDTGVYGEWLTSVVIDEPTHCVSLAADPVLESGLYVGSPEGLHYFTLSGAWELVTSDIVVSGEDSVDVIEINDSGIFASTVNGIYYAEDADDTFTNISTTLLSSQPLTLETLSGSLYAGTVDGVYEAILTADSWTKFDAGYYYYELPGADLYLSVPTLSGETTGQILAEGTDYELYQMRYLKFFDEFETSNEQILNGERFLSTSDLVLAPTLKHIFFPGFGITSPATLVDNGEYPPYLSGVDVDLLSNYEYKQYYADHLMKWSHALSAKLRHPPTVDNLTDIYGYIKGLPFAYEDSWFDSTWSGANSTFAKFVTSGSDDYYIYEIPYPLEYFEYSYGDYVDKFDLIGSGINIVDYVKNITLISGILEEHGSEITTLTTKNLLFLEETNRLYLAGIKETNNDEVIAKFVTDIAPLGLTKLVGNREPQVELSEDLIIYEPSGLGIEVPIDVTDAEDDILTYKLRFLSPDHEYLTDNVLTITATDALTSLPTFVPDQRPPVDTSYRFTVEVDDIYHTVETSARNFVAGDVPFVQWGQPDYGFPDEFAIGDVDIEYTYLSGLINSGMSIDFNQPYYIEDDDHHPKDFALFKDDEELYHLYFLRNKVVKYPAPPQSNYVGDEPYFGHATSYDLRNWTDQDPVLACADGEEWEDTFVWAPDVIRNPFNTTEGHALYGLGKYLMLYTGVMNDYPGDDVVTQRMGLAFSDDGNTWTRYEGNPVIDPADFHYDGVDSDKWMHWKADVAWDATFRDPCIIGPIDVNGADTWYVLNTAEIYINDINNYQALSACSSTDLVTWTELGYPFLAREDTPDASHELPESPDLLYADDEWHLFFNDGKGANHVAQTELLTPWTSTYNADDLSGPYDANLQTIEFYEDTIFGTPHIMVGKRLCTGGPGRGYLAFYGADFTSGDPYSLTHVNNFYSTSYGEGLEYTSMTDVDGKPIAEMGWERNDAQTSGVPTAYYDTLVSGIYPSNEGEYRLEPDGADWIDATYASFARTDMNSVDADKVLTRQDGSFDYYYIDDGTSTNDRWRAWSREIETNYVRFRVYPSGDSLINLAGAPTGSETITLYYQSLPANSFKYQPTIGDGPADRGGDSSGMTGNAYIATREKHYTPYYDSTSGTYGQGTTFGFWENFGWVNSSNFTISKNRISLMVGGGNHPNTEFVALVDTATDRVLFKETGEDSDVMTKCIWNTTELRGREVYLVIADLTNDTWGFISCDAIHEYTETDPNNDETTAAEPLGDSGPLISTLTDIVVDLDN